MIPSGLLLRYFETAQLRLRNLPPPTTTPMIDEKNDGLDNSRRRISSSSSSSSSRSSRHCHHRERIVDVQLVALDEAIDYWSRRTRGRGRRGGKARRGGRTRCDHDDDANGDDCDHDDEGGGGGGDSRTATRERALEALRGIGRGDHSLVSYDDDDYYDIDDEGGAMDEGGGDDDDERGWRRRRTTTTATTIAEAAELTNDAARTAYARSVLMDHWRRDDEDDVLDEDLDEDFDDEDGEECLALATAAVRLPEVRRYLRFGASPYPPRREGDVPSSSSSSSPEARLRRVRSTCRRALGRSSRGEDERRRRRPSSSTAAATATAETRASYANAVAEAMSYDNHDYDDGNDAPYRHDDGTTRVVSVVHTEWVVGGSTTTTTTSSSDADAAVGCGGTMMTPSSAPTSDVMDGRIVPTTHVRHHLREGDDDDDKVIADDDAAAALRRAILDEFRSLDEDDRVRTVREARDAHARFVEAARGASSGAERVRLVRDMDEKTQRLLVMYKLWCDDGE